MSQMICLAGMPGSGKTTWAQEFLKKHPDFLYFSPDSYYERINGDECDRTDTFEIWMAMFRDIHIAEKNFNNVLIDSDNLTYAQRNQWIEWFPDFQHILVFFEASWNTCYEQMLHRRRQLSYDTMITKWEKWQRPTKELDGKFWDKIYRGNYNTKEQ